MVKELVLLGFGNLHQFKNITFFLFLTIYFTIVFGNMCIIGLITIIPKLHSPMYFFLWNLSASEMLFASILMPSILYVVWWNGASMSLYGCIAQFYLGATAASAECLLLTVMAYDRYLAICKPLRYSSIMNVRTRNHLAVWAWLFSSIVMLLSTPTVYNLKFCGLNTLDYLFCDLAPILQLATSDSSLAKSHALLLTVILCLLPFVVIILSYVSIFWTILKMSSMSGSQKAFSTCSSHLASVCTYFGTIFIIYFVPSQQSSLKLNKILSLLYTIGTPLLNPIIYSLRNQEMKACFKAYFHPVNIKQ